MGDSSDIRKVVLAQDLSSEEIKALKSRFNSRGQEKNTPEHIVAKEYKRIGIIGDVHLNSKECNLEFLHKAYGWFRDMHADFVVQAGDLTEGEEMRRDQKFGLVNQGIDAVVGYVLERYPLVGLNTYFIGGNHDQAYQKHAGHDICAHIASKRQDLIYLGQNEGDLPGDVIDCKFKLWHPSKGSAKGKSYQIQELLNYFVNQCEDKPQVLVVGHYHKFDWIFEHNVHAYQAGTIQDQSDWMRTKNLAAEQRVWLLDIYCHEGQVEHVTNRERSIGDLLGVER